MINTSNLHESLNNTRKIKRMNDTELLDYDIEKYGNINFISFFAVVLSRLAYLDDNQFLKRYNKIMGYIIPSSLLTAIDAVKSTKLDRLLDDSILLKKHREYIDFFKKKLPQNINIANNHIQAPLDIDTQPPNKNVHVKYISIGWSNYGEIYVVADKRMPNTIFLLFRGTNSWKTTSLYSKPTSFIPLSIEGIPSSDRFVYGIFKPTVEVIHTII